MAKQPIIPKNYDFKGYFIPVEILKDTRLTTIEKNDSFS